MGVADIIDGLIVFPTTVNTILKVYQHTLQLQAPIIIGQKQFLSMNESYNYKNATSTTNMLETITMAKNRIFPLIYKNSIGVFTSASFTASIYLLTVSGIDRLRAFWKPLHYNQNVAKHFAILSSIICWILAIFVSVLPTFVGGLSYQIIVSSPALFSGKAAITLYLVIINLPLIAAWIISVLTYLINRKALDRNLSNSQNNVKKQRKLNSILFLLVTAFSLCLLPAVMVLILLLFIPGIDPKFPQVYNSSYGSIVKSLQMTSAIILASNSLWNFLIYSFRIKTFRKVALKKYKKILNQTNCCKLFSTSK